MQQNLQQKKKLVEGVFNNVFDKYDLMNDFMALGYVLRSDIQLREGAVVLRKSD